MGDYLDEKNAELERALSEHARLKNDYENTCMAVDVFGDDGDSERAVAIANLLLANSEEIQQLQNAVEEAQKELESTEYEGTSSYVFYGERVNKTTTRFFLYGCIAGLVIVGLIGLIGW